MKRDAESLSVLIAELEEAHDRIAAQYRQNREMTGRIERAGKQADAFAWAALGYTLHNIYNAFENYFLRVAKYFENSLENLEWHKDLLDRMSLEVEGVRPALLDRAHRDQLHELRRFRHVFRNIYDTTLDPERVERVNRTTSHIAEGFVKAHGEFLGKLRVLRDALEG